MEIESGKGEFKHRVYNFILRLIWFLHGLPRSQTLHVIRGQLLRSGTSIGANYFEAHAACSRRDFINYFHHSLKSANESKFWLDLVRDTCSIHSSELEPLLKELSEISKILAKSLVTLKNGNKS